VSEDVVEVWEAAELLGIPIPETYDLVFSRQLASVEAPNGRRLVPRTAIDAWKTGPSPGRA
jgi:excisionase family DNA binding protein